MLVKYPQECRLGQSALGGFAEEGYMIASSESGNLVIDVVSDLGTLLGKGGRRGAQEGGGTTKRSLGPVHQAHSLSGGSWRVSCRVSKQKRGASSWRPLFSVTPLSGKVLSLPSGVCNGGQAYVVRP